ncbi:hypothetical protein AMECASPLE_019211 [Ameca splendens]|uniref:Secreted protein n=1 Tax=Ameca splendens TaxID=208324 RepID=A0ABV0Z1T1_9TELE
MPGSRGRCTGRVTLSWFRFIVLCWFLRSHSLPPFTTLIKFCVLLRSCSERTHMSTVRDGSLSADLCLGKQLKQEINWGCSPDQPTDCLLEGCGSWNNLYKRRSPGCPAYQGRNAEATV